MVGVHLVPPIVVPPAGVAPGVELAAWLPDVVVVEPLFWPAFGDVACAGFGDVALAGVGADAFVCPDTFIVAGAAGLATAALGPFGVFDGLAAIGAAMSVRTAVQPASHVVVCRMNDLLRRGREQ